MEGISQDVNLEVTKAGSILSKERALDLLEC